MMVILFPVFSTTLKNNQKNVFQFLIISGKIDLKFVINRNGEFSVMATNERTTTSKQITIVRPSHFSNKEIQEMKSEIAKISSSNEDETETDIKKQRLSCNLKFRVPPSSKCNVYPCNLSKFQSRKQNEGEDLVLGQVDDIEDDEQNVGEK